MIKYKFKIKPFIILSSLFLIPITVWGNNARYRVMFRSNPATSITIGWDQTSGKNPMVYYDIVDHGKNSNAYTFTKSVDRSVNHKGMNNNFARLTGLQPNTAYYFVIKDSKGISPRFWFKTAPGSSNEQLSFIAGGDSRNNSKPRRNANLLVSKLRPHAVFFGGDMTKNGSNTEWIEWMNDWQLTTGSDGRMIPIIPARGNHESSNNNIYHLFDTPSKKIYYALTFGGNLIRAYTLNTEISISGNQTSWLKTDLASNPNVIWKMAQYHKPMRPHVSAKKEGNSQYKNWAIPFRNYGVKFVVESDAHVVKTTWPIVPCRSSESDDGFIRDDVNGTVYAGEGCWGAPLRTNDDSKKWTRATGRFNQFKWIHINASKIEIRTINVNNANLVEQINDHDIFAIPSNLDIWNPSSGAVVTISKLDDIPITAKCSSTLSSFPYSTGFENTLDSWTQSSTDDINWLLRSGKTPSDGTGPSAAAQGNYYIYVEASNQNSPRKLASLESPCFNLSTISNPQISFNYHMYGTTVGTLTLEVSTNQGISWNTLWIYSGTQSHLWKSQTVNIPNSNSAKFRFRGLTGSGWSSDLAIDNFKIAPKSAP